jgi:isoquinoline 1-oxidoreductase alpha subunit
MPLLWVVRDVLGLKGTKFGCGQAMCGACTLHVNGEAVRSCSYAAKFADGKNITTIEGLVSGDKLHAVQQAWLDEKVPQCGYCQPGFIMATASLLEKIPTPTDEEINDNITNICRCGTYYRIRKAIHRAVELNKVNL